MPSKPTLESYADSVLQQLGLGDATAEEKKKYIPRLVQALEYRLGAALLPHVPDSAAQEFQQLLETDSNESGWFEFWNRVVPNFEERVKKVLADFVLECQKIVAY